MIKRFSQTFAKYETAAGGYQKNVFWDSGEALILLITTRTLSMTQATYCCIIPSSVAFFF